ncbi:efflux RND transporter periplasmic adaptor subunit [Silvibacterium dinghuense]|uniref:Efflux RND transporter periplasmic adaptor subunit n=1 Tax=Silvibacterium dinghuense TaxID=1560006 RepID=A0A4Q1SD71_9BACT|nr:efflux RND transporter periplasmic adaptor subunit [Silvibacterium dinghuense]RXS95043.1 efflux RND transporter periplasmic adaptor subunit [Silvibacterium dinghuense]GGH10089.1 RND transporter MFP subunit [Silvibacterium dinghuense]
MPNVLPLALKSLRLTAPLTAALALSFVIGCTKKEAEPDVSVSVQAAHPELGSITQQITADAVLAPIAQAAISPKITAPVKKFYVQRGSRVKTGQLLATLENSDLEAAALDNRGAYDAAKAAYATSTKAQIPEDYQRAELDLAQAKANLDLNKSIVTARKQLFAEGAIPGRDLDTATAALVQAQAAYDTADQHFESMQKVSRGAAVQSAEGQLASAKGKYLGAEAQVSYSELRSPIDGIVTDRPLFAGETAASGAPLITVMETAKLLAKVHLAQSLAQQIKVGDDATVTVPGLDDPVQAKVSLVSPALDPGSTTVEVWLTLANQDSSLKVGTPVHVAIAGHTVKNILSLPLSALLVNDSGSHYVMVVGADGIAHKRAVTTGIQDNADVEIRSGLTAADNVITTGAYGLDDGTKVTVGAASDDDSDAKPAAGKEGK